MTFMSVLLGDPSSPRARNDLSILPFPPSRHPSFQPLPPTSSYRLLMAFLGRGPIHMGWCFLLWACCCWAVVNSAEPSDKAETVEVDLVFPHNETYAPAAFIPIVFAVQNFHASHALNLGIHFQVVDANSGDKAIQYNIFDLDPVKYPSNASDLQFVYDWTNRLNNTEGRWVIKWQIYASNCTNTGRGPQSLKVDPLYLSQALYFSTSHSAPQPDLVAATKEGVCDKTQGSTFTITKVEDVMYRGPGDIDVCPLVATVAPTPKPCLAKIDATAASSISYEIQTRACMEGLNPKVTCPPRPGDKSAASQLLPFSLEKTSWLVVALAGYCTLLGHVISAQTILRQPSSPGYSGRDACPGRCIDSGSNPSNWSVYHNFYQFQSCHQTLFHEFNIHDQVDDDNTLHRIYSCASYGSDWENLPALTSKTPVKSIDSLQKNATFEIEWGTDNLGRRSTVGDIVVLLKQLRQYLSNGHGSTTRPELLFAQVGQTAIGLYIGKALQKEGISFFALKALEDEIFSLKMPSSSVVMQMCDLGISPDHVFGIMTTSNGTFSPIQNAIRAWISADCLSLNSSSTFTGPIYFNTAPMARVEGAPLRDRNVNFMDSPTSKISRLSVRGGCRTVQVQSGDSCASLAEECGISGASFMKYNPGSDFCATLMPGQHACCSLGSLPDFRPKSNSDGSCHVYTVHAGDSCSSIAAANSVTIKDLETFNKRTWGWNGCQNIWASSRICLSTGAPPMPAPMPNAVCGPQVPGTQPPAAGSDISQLNPCPLSACCDVWGQCGTTEEFCVDTGTGAPGTARAGTNGCISNCGTSIVRGDPPAEFRKIGYFEGYGFSSRECLYQDALQIDASQYTHIHFAFGMITHDYQIHTGDAETTYEFENFKRIQGAKRILSFGGWEFSTSQATYAIFREGVKDANRLVLAMNIANFIKRHGLDGVDIDWEYPSAPDLPNIPPASKEEGMDYFKFLVILKNLLPDKSVSIAAPASYWYLKGFPIRIISFIVDYIVFMTYDLHGQWDAHNQWSQVGCPSGMCLRSSVNLTETINSLVMITKAGVPSSKIVVGVTSYGRSFSMAQAGCHGPNCFYTGGPLNSNAKKGRCTNIAGYIADAEIKEIIQDQSRVNQNYVDGPSHSNILVYDNTQWVSYMSPEVLSLRTQLYRSLNMGGTTNWAIDLETFHDIPKDSGAPSWAIFKEKLKSGLDPYQKGQRHGNWTSLTCNDRAVEDLDDLTPSERWSRLDAPDAWNDVLDIWTTYYASDKHRSFSQAITDTLQGPTDVHCETIAQSNHCDSTKECTDFVGSGTGPAGYEIFNSFVEINGWYSDFHQSLADISALYISNTLPDFENKFAPVPPPADNKKWLLLLIDLITLGVGLFELPYFMKNSAAADTLKDTTMTLIGQSTTIAKNMLSTDTPGHWTAGKQAQFSHYMGQALNAWGDLAERSVGILFNGSDESVALLTSLVSDGKLISGKGRKEAAYDKSALLKAAIGKAFFAYSIPAIWSVSGASPFIIDSGSACGTLDPIAGYMSPDGMHKSWHCVDNKLYYLASPKGDAKNCLRQGIGYPEKCKDRQFSALPGIEWLDGSSFGGVTLGDLISGSVRTYKANGNRNVNISPDPSKLLRLDAAGHQDITVPGFIRMPVCSAGMAFKAWVGNHDGPDTSAPGYPCVIPKNDDYCGASTFVDQTSGASPTVSDCRKLIEKIQARPDPTDHEVENAISSQHQIEEYGSCKFGVQGHGKHGNVDFHVGGQDIINLINDSISRFGSSGRVGSKGSMSCKGTVRGQDVEWGLY
ncbi:chitinase [Metarhizium rileyi]|uniref:chitinase n=1 Tax=Metarhizium rileyi (strain RCEF 4871) TaxID=1649241 RepID=A0A166Y3L5_METRR|nr:chitinase [Metarhizium rileyi RCEF 4871]